MPWHQWLKGYAALSVAPDVPCDGEGLLVVRRGPGSGILGKCQSQGSKLGYLILRLFSLCSSILSRKIQSLSNNQQESWYTKSYLLRTSTFESSGLKPDFTLISPGTFYNHLDLLQNNWIRLTEGKVFYKVSHFILIHTQGWEPLVLYNIKKAGHWLHDLSKVFTSFKKVGYKVSYKYLTI